MKKGPSKCKICSDISSGYFGLENWGFSHWDGDFWPLGVELEEYWDPKNNFTFRWWNQRYSRLASTYIPTALLVIFF